MRVLLLLCAGLFLIVGLTSCDREVSEPVSSGGFTAYPGMPPYEPVLGEEGSADGDNLNKILASARAASNHTPLPDWEAEELAMALSRELTAPRNLYNRIKKDLARIRAEYGEDVPAVNIQFYPTFISGGIYIKYYPEILDDSSTEAFEVFHSLNAAFGVKQLRQASDRSYELVLDGRYNPVRLVDQFYCAVPGGIEAMYSTYRLMTDHSGMYVAIDGKRLKYFFRDAWGDCPSGCLFEHVHYFTSNGGRITYCDDYLRDVYPPPTPPVWYADYVTAVRSFSYGIRWYPDSAVYWP